MNSSTLLKFAQIYDDLDLFEQSDSSYKLAKNIYAQKSSAISPSEVARLTQKYYSKSPNLIDNSQVKPTIPLSTQSNKYPKTLQDSLDKLPPDKKHPTIESLKRISDRTATARDIYILANNLPRAVMTFVPGLTPSQRNNLLSLADRADQIGDAAFQAEMIAATQGKQFLTSTARAKAGDKLLNLVKSNPRMASKIEKFLPILQKYFPKLQGITSGSAIFGRFTGGVISLAFSFPAIVRYLDLAYNGKFESEIMGDAEERAMFFETMASVVGGFMMGIPGLNVIGLALQIGAGASAGGRMLANWMYKDETNEAISQKEFVSDNFVDLYEKADPEVQKLVGPILKELRLNPNLKNIEILNKPYIASVPWIKNRKTSLDNLKYLQFNGIIASTKKYLKKQRKQFSF